MSDCCYSSLFISSFSFFSFTFFFTIEYISEFLEETILAIISSKISSSPGVYYLTKLGLFASNLISYLSNFKCSYSFTILFLSISSYFFLGSYTKLGGSAISFKGSSLQTSGELSSSSFLDFFDRGGKGDFGCGEPNSSSLKFYSSVIGGCSNSQSAFNFFKQDSFNSSQNFICFPISYTKSLWPPKAQSLKGLSLGLIRAISSQVRPSFLKVFSSSFDIFSKF